IPAFADMQVYQEGKLAPATQTMTVHQLFTHTAGLSYGYPDDHPVHKLLDTPVNTDPVTDGLDYATRIAALPLQYEPGSAWHYSFASDVLGALVEVASGQSLADYFAEHIFSPLSMIDTSYSVSDEKITRLTTAHQWDSQAAQLQELSGPPFSAPYRYLPVDGGGAGLVSTAGDYLRLLEMLRQGGSLDGQRILGPKTVQFMTLDHLPRSLTDANEGENLNLTLGRGGSHGLGIGIYLDPVRRGVLSSPGELEWGGAYQTIYWWDPVEDILLVSMLQLGGSPFSLQYRDDLAVAVYQALTTLQP
ncbi:MAG: serine hydrolase domain-containing protein, partial [Pseudomonadota bacterium]